MYMYTLNSLKCFSQHIVHFRFVVQIAAILLTASCVKGQIVDLVSPSPTSYCDGDATTCRVSGPAIFWQASPFLDAAVGYQTQDSPPATNTFADGDISISLISNNPLASELVLRGIDTVNITCSTLVSKSIQLTRSSTPTPCG
ncbi:uncharacterized protein LOC135333617 [Halichondria panicea]|uniref:uncharacterized protein LOC135333617 n=1 Tax=Halichondria panicea TaxID=6063 RepID=UPI00312BCB8F